MSLLQQLLHEFYLWVRKPSRPALIYLVNVKEIPNMADKLKVTLSLPPISAPDVKSRKLSVTIDGGLTVDSSPDLGASLFDISVDQDAPVHVELRDIDDSGNPSDPSVLDFVATDTASTADRATASH